MLRLEFVYTCSIGPFKGVLDFGFDGPRDLAIGVVVLPVEPVKILVLRESKLIIDVHNFRVAVTIH